MEQITYEKGFTAQPLPEEIIKKIDGKSYRENHDIGLDELAYLKMLYVDFHGMTQTGVMIVHYSLAKEVLEIFCELYKAGKSAEEILGLNIPTGTPLVYEFDDEFNVIGKEYLCDPDELAAKMNSVANQGKAK